MDTDIKERVITKLFVGCVLTTEIRIALNHSSAWNQAKILADESELKEQRFQGKDYFGIFVHSDQIPIHELRLREAAVRSRLRFYCPALANNHFNVYLLPITLVT